MESKAFINFINALFPTYTIYEESIPKNFKRPSFLIVTPDLQTEVKQRTRFFYTEVKTFFMYGFVSKDVLGSTKDKVLAGLPPGKKLLIPDSDNRYLAIESIRAKTSDEDSVIEFIIRAEKNCRAIPESNVPKINEVKHNVKIDETLAVE